jgi:hypothetical protein
MLWLCGRVPSFACEIPYPIYYIPLAISILLVRYILYSTGACSSRKIPNKRRRRPGEACPEPTCLEHIRRSRRERISKEFIPPFYVGLLSCRRATDRLARGLVHTNVEEPDQRVPTAADVLLRRGIDASIGPCVLADEISRG